MKTHQWLLILLILSILLFGCSPSVEDKQETIKLTLGAYTTPREAYRELIPLFAADFLAQTGQKVTFEESYLGSGAQSRAIVEGFEADVTALSLEADVKRIQEGGLITHDWRAEGPNQGIVTTSIVVFAVRKDNPENIQDWADLARPGIEVLTPNPKTSGGAMWNILALYGAALRGQVKGVPGDDPQAAGAFLLQVLKNVIVMDKGARESIITFEKGIGDVAITYENEVLVGQMGNQDYEMIIPGSTILIDNPIAVVDVYADQHGTRQAAEAFVAFLYRPEAQRIFAKYGLRPVEATAAAEAAQKMLTVKDLFTISYFNGWEAAMPDFFGSSGIYTLLAAELGK
jgi:sulfate transport system substrate-binding protein